MLIITQDENKNLLPFTTNEKTTGKIIITITSAKDLHEFINASCKDWKKGIFFIRKTWKHKNQTFFLKHELCLKNYTLKKAVNDWKYYFPEIDTQKNIEFNKHINNVRSICKKLNCKPSDLLKLDYLNELGYK